MNFRNAQQMAKKQQSETSTELTQAIHEVARGGRTAILSGLFGYLIRIGLQILLSRMLGAHAYGLYTLGRSLLDILSQFGLVGTQNAVVRFIAIFQGEGNEAQVRGTIVLALSLVVSMSITIGAGLWFASDWLAISIFNKPSFGYILRIFAVALPFYTALTLLASCARGFRQMVYFSGMTNVVHPFGVFLCIAVTFLVGMRLEGALFGFTVATALASMLMLYGIMRLFPQLWSLQQGLVNPGPPFLTYAAKALLGDFTHHILRHADRLMLGSMGVARDVGVYSISAFIGDKLTFFPTMLNSIFAPVIADLYNRGKHDELIRLFQIVSKWTLLLTLPVFGTCLFLGDFILTLFGSDFREGLPVLIILASAYLVNISVGPVGYILMMTGRPGLSMINNCLAGVINIVLNLWLIPRHGILGAAIATGVTAALVNLIRLVQVRYLYQCYPFYLGTLKTLMACVIAGAVVWQLGQHYQLENWGKVAVMGTGIILYAGFLALFGWDEEDRLIIDRLRRIVLKS
jgi:O-antigen/teichoic acid export membrane protein